MKREKIRVKGGGFRAETQRAQGDFKSHPAAAGQKSKAQSSLLFFICSSVSIALSFYLNQR
jgi:hypothetical protein